MLVKTKELVSDVSACNGRVSSPKKAYLGSYMPFAGVRYYSIFDDQDIAEGNTRIGPVGWRPAESKPAEREQSLAAA